MSISSRRQCLRTHDMLTRLALTMVDARKRAVRRSERHRRCQDRLRSAVLCACAVQRPLRPIAARPSTHLVCLLCCVVDRAQSRPLLARSSRCSTRRLWCVKRAQALYPTWSERWPRQDSRHCHPSSRSSMDHWTQPPIANRCCACTGKLCDRCPEFCWSGRHTKQRYNGKTEHSRGRISFFSLLRRSPASSASLRSGPAPSPSSPPNASCRSRCFLDHRQTTNRCEDLLNPSCRLFLLPS